MTPVPEELLERLAKTAPWGSAVIPLDWAYEDEDHNIVVLIDDREAVRRTEDQLLDVVSDYDEAHGTFTICLVWAKDEKALAITG
ncbi:MAG: hypothetical protein M3361_07855 [Candidatus Tectomicrobia bacterium]|nr:hypothetical protein [Candidatus Tectomicrobia bacterium]